MQNVRSRRYQSCSCILGAERRMSLLTTRSLSSMGHGTWKGDEVRSRCELRRTYWRLRETMYLRRHLRRGSRRGRLFDTALNDFRVETGDRSHFFRFSCPSFTRSIKGLTNLTTAWSEERYANNKSRSCRIPDQCAQSMHGFQFSKTGVMTRRRRIKGDMSKIMNGWPQDLY